MSAILTPDELTLAEVGLLLRCDSQLVRKLFAAGELRGYHLGEPGPGRKPRIRIHAASVEAFKVRRANQAPATPTPAPAVPSPPPARRPKATRTSSRVLIAPAR